MENWIINYKEKEYVIDSYLKLKEYYKDIIELYNKIPEDGYIDTKDISKDMVDNPLFYIMFYHYGNKDRLYIRKNSSCFPIGKYAIDKILEKKISFKEFINILVEKKCNILNIRDEQLVRRFVNYIASDIKDKIEKENYIRVFNYIVNKANNKIKLYDRESVIIYDIDNTMGIRKLDLNNTITDNDIDYKEYIIDGMESFGNFIKEFNNKSMIEDWTNFNDNVKEEIYKRFIDRYCNNSYSNNEYYRDERLLKLNKGVYIFYPNCRMLSEIGSLLLNIRIIFDKVAKDKVREPVASDPAHYAYFGWSLD